MKAKDEILKLTLSQQRDMLEDFKSPKLSVTKYFKILKKQLTTQLKGFFNRIVQ